MISAVTSYFSAVINNCGGTVSGQKCQTNLPNVSASTSNIQSALQIVFGVIAVATVIYIIIAAIRFQVSLGNPEATAKLRNAIVYAAIGLVVALSAEIIVTFVLGKI